VRTKRAEKTRVDLRGLCPRKAARCKRVRPQRGGTLQNGIIADFRGFTAVCVTVAQAWCTWLAGVDPKRSHNMVHALILDIWTWPRGDVPGLGLIDEDVGLLRGDDVTSRPRA